MSTAATVHEPRFLLHQATWKDYVSLRDADENRNTRMTFDRGSLEFMSPTRLHERLRILVGRCIDVWVEEMRIRIQSCSSTTFRREDLQRGLEPDHCYYIQHESVVRDRDEELDLTVDPPPDLAIEVDITSSSINRMSIYAAFGIPEICRWHDDKVSVHVLGAEGKYSEAAASQALPGFPLHQMAEIIRRLTFADALTFVDEFRSFCRALPKKK
jgi:Uma2 family endonuclease